MKLIKFLIQAFRNQRRLKPKYYQLISWVGGIGCFISIVLWYSQLGLIAEVMNIDMDMPLRKMSGYTQISILSVMLFSFVLAMYIGCLALTILVFLIPVSLKYLTLEEYFNITLLCSYPERWYKGT